MLELKHITFEVEENGNRSKIIDDLSFQVEAGKFVVITGPNGGGKSTTARLIMGILVTLLKNGTVRLERGLTSIT